MMMMMMTLMMMMMIIYLKIFVRSVAAVFGVPLRPGQDHFLISSYIYLNIFVVRLVVRGRSATPGAMVPSPGTNEHPIGRTELLVTPIESP